MKMPCISKDCAFNVILVLNIVALITIHWSRHDLTTLEWSLRSALAIHLVLRWPHIFYERNGWKR